MIIGADIEEPVLLASVPDDVFALG